MSYIEKEPIVAFITKGLNNLDKTKAFGYDAIEILTEIEYSPTADVVEVVRCKDCKHYKDEHSNCWLMRVKMMPSDYCSYGERKEDK